MPVKYIIYNNLQVILYIIYCGLTSLRLPSQVFLTDSIKIGLSHVYIV